MEIKLHCMAEIKLYCMAEVKLHCMAMMEIKLHCMEIKLHCMAVLISNVAEGQNRKVRKIQKPGKHAPNPAQTWETFQLPNKN